MERIFQMLRSPLPWGVGVFLWAMATFIASSFTLAAPSHASIEFEHLDKILHFCWFAAGGFVLTNGIRFRNQEIRSIWWKWIFPCAMMSILGALDEYRQSFTPGRCGNDVGDWIADSLGGAFGVAIANGLHQLKVLMRLKRSIP